LPPGGQPGTSPTAPNGNPEQGAQPGAGGNAVPGGKGAPGGDKRGRDPAVADPQRK
jgi:hypothetical protein